MAIQNKLVDIKPQIRVEDTSTGELKNLNFTRIKCAATSDELYAAANAIAAAVGHPHGGDRRSG